MVDENPSTTDGAIGIMDYLSTLVPLYPDGRPHTIITHCDGGAFERMVGGKKVRAADGEPITQLLGLEPSAQEFHKRGSMLQVYTRIVFCMSVHSKLNTVMIHG
jgi:hypothetical protein